MLGVTGNGEVGCQQSRRLKVGREIRDKLLQIPHFPDKRKDGLRSQVTFQVLALKML
jgi:hypothetical protein